MHPLLRTLGIDLPIIQAPMAGISTPQMAAAVSNAGALGSIGVGAMDAESTRQSIVAVRTQTDRPFHVNLFCHQPAVADPDRETHWLRWLEPEFRRYGATPPTRLAEVYKSFLVDDEKLAVLLQERPPIVSFHFGLPGIDRIEALRSAGVKLLATATNLAEGRVIADAGIDAIVAQGYEAGGHRGMFNPADRDDQLGTLSLVRLLVRKLDVPIIAAGGIMDGAGIAASLRLGAAAAQLGTAFIACPESSADAGFRAALFGPSSEHTVMTAAISGRPARCLANRFTELGTRVAPSDIPAYPIAYDAGKGLNAAAKARGEFGYGAHWAGQSAPLARSLPAAELVAALKSETEQAIAKH